MSASDPAGISSPRLHRKWLLLVVASAVANSLNGVIVRSVETADEWQIIFYRSGALGTALVVVFLVQSRWRIRATLRELRPWSILGSVAIATTNTFFIVSIVHTTVANTMFVMSAAPFFTALLGWAVLGETVGPSMWVAMSVALAGIGIMLGDGLGAGNFYGNGFAVLAALSFACFVVVLRKGRATNMLPVVALGAVFSGLVGALLSGFDFDVRVRDVALLIFWGGVLSAVVHVLFTFAARHVPGAELALLILVEFVLAPVWVWLAIDEIPTVATLVGGALVITAVASRPLASLMSERTSEPGRPD